MIMQKLMVLSIGLVMLLSTSSVQAELDIQGFLKNYGGINTHYYGQWDRLYGHLQLQFSGRTGQRIAYRADVVARYNYLSDRNATAPRSIGMEIYPAELYVDYYGDWLDLRIGQQYLFWGRADWINPTDVFNPWDYANMSSDIEDYRIPIPAAKMSIYPSFGHLELIYAPRLIPDKIPVPFSPSVADSRINLGQFGFRFAHDLSAIAWSAYVYHGWRKQAELEEIILTMDYQLIKKFRFHKLDMVGADFIYTGEKWAIKGEGAMNFSDDSKGDNPYIINDNIYSTLGGDWIPNDKFSFNLQGTIRHYLSYNRQTELQTLRQVRMEHFITAVQENDYSLSNVIRYKMTNFINLQSIAVLNLADKDWFWLPFVSWEVADATQVTLGGIFFDGPMGSDFGNSADSDQVFFQLKTSF